MSQNVDRPSPCTSLFQANPLAKLTTRHPLKNILMNFLRFGSIMKGSLIYNRQDPEQKTMRRKAPRDGARTFTKGSGQSAASP
uniref:Uncharacterized protein n=1 Tax=Leptospirillum ferrodiazotrophum TaxID=412449 RepID=C6HWV7_9BACT|nr:MAG: hypothetical protein UBAL3_82700031 [Leptospirillum ferrodiazotrophum]